MSSRELLSLEEDPIVVTGMGCVTPLGLDVQSTWDGLMAGRNGFINLREETDLLKDYSLDAIRAEVAAPVSAAFDLKENPIFDKRELRKKFSDWHRATQFGIWAAAQATEQAGLLAEQDGVPILKLHGDIDPFRVSVFNGTGIGGAAELIEIHERLTTKERPIVPSMTMRTLPERVASVLSMELGSRGPTAVLMGACATGNMNIAQGYLMLKSGMTDIAIVGGTEAAIIPEALAMFDGVGAMDRTTDPSQASRPFHEDENGFIMGEGAGILVLERESRAKARGAIILARLSGIGWTSDAFHDTFPDPDGVGQIRAMNDALEEAASFIDPSESGYVNPHGTGTGGDDGELRAMSNSNIRHTGNRKTVASSTKSSMGHTIGAAGAIESVVVVKAIEEREAPATLKYSPETAVESARDWDIVYDSPRSIPDVGWGVNNSFGFGGFDTVTVYTRPR